MAENQSNNKDKGKILVVEDDMHLMEGIHDILEIHGYEVLTATNGVTGLEVLRGQPKPPDLIVSDIMMPRMNGYQFFEEVQGDDKWVDIPFIFLTAKGERDDIHFGKKLGVDDYVVKPFDAEDLLVAVSAKLRVARERIGRQTKKYDELKHKILTILNHEFRTPLTYIVAYADMVHRDASSLSAEEMDSFVRGINTGANRLRRLVENFMLLIELITGEAKKNLAYRRQIIDDYAGYIGQLVEKYQDFAAEQEVKLALDVDDDLPPIEADTEYLNAAIESLLDNAIKFTDKPGETVLISVFAENGQLCLSVKDKGRGIPASELDEVMKPFVQFQRETFEDQGAGSGLAIVDGVAKLHGGSVNIHSEEGKGTEVVMRLPVAQFETA